MTRRREVLISLGVCALSTAVSSVAQQTKTWRIGFLFFGSRPEPQDVNFAAFVGGLRELGYVEGKNLVIDWRFAEGSYDRLAALAGDLVRSKMDLIVAASTQGAQAAKRATTIIPIVMVGVGDPVGAGLVASLSRPGGNITGLSNLAVDVGGKQVELLHAAIPKLARVAVLLNPTHPNHPQVLKQIQAAASKTTTKVLVVEADKPDQLERVLSTLTRQHADALIVAPDPFFLMQRKQIAQIASKNRLPSIFWNRDLAQAGGLMSYGQSLAEQYRRAATYVDRILKGAKPGDLPVEQPTKLEFVINLKTAKAIGLAIPQGLLVRADEVIQ